MIHYHVEVKFNHEDEWRRNHQRHKDIEVAKGMAQYFKKMGETRIVKIKTDIMEEKLT